MPNTLVTPEDLEEFTGAPFTEGAVDIAAAGIRAEARWHIAPAVTETIEVESHGGRYLTLPTLKIGAVSAIRDVTTGTPLTLTGWSRRLGGQLYRWLGWPYGIIEVDLTHGYPETPRDLFPVIALRVRNLSSDRTPGLVSRSVTRGPFSEQESYRDDVSAADPVILRYRLPDGVA